MNLPFGLPAITELGTKKKEGLAQATALYERKLTEYREALEQYKKCILDYSVKLDGYDRRYMDNQLSVIQTTLDITYLKEQSDKTMEVLKDLKDGTMNNALIQLEGLVTAIIDTNYKLDGLDNSVVNSLTELLTEMQKQANAQTSQLQLETIDNIEQLGKSVKRGHALLWFVFIFNIIGLSGIALLILYSLEMISF